MSTKPERVELLERGMVKLVLHDSDRGTLNGRTGPNGKYKGRATSARIFGKAGSGAVFYDNRDFKTSENHVYVEKLTDDPVEVPLAQDFLDPRVMGERGNGMFTGEENGRYKWALFKSVKKDWLARSVPLDWDRLREEANQNGSPTVKAGVAIFTSVGLGKSKSRNYRVDNCSSVQFAGPGSSL